MQNHKKIGTLVALAILISGCGSSGSSGGSTTTDVTNSLATAYPSDLAVTSPTASSTASGNLSVKATIKPPTISEKKQHMVDLLNGTKKSDCTFSFDMTASPPYASCYGPSINYSNHPDASGGQSPSGQMPSGDLGIWTATESTTGEACVAARLNYVVGQIMTNVNMATDMGAAILCGANVAGKSLPEKGVTEDLTTVSQDVMTTNAIPMTVTSATLARDASDSSDGPVYTMSITGSVSFSPPGQSAQNSNFTMTLKHIPKSTADNSTYKGRLNMKMAHDTTAANFFGLGNCGDVLSGPTTTDILDAFSIEYTKSSETSLTYVLKRAEFCGADEPAPFDAQGNVDLTNKHDGTKKNGWANNGNYQIASFNPQDGTGNYAFAWQAGSRGGNSRALDVTVTNSGTEGCGYFGFGPDIAETSGVGGITKMICNWAGPGQGPAGGKAGVVKAQRECFKKSDTIFVVDATTDSSRSLAITYAPTLTCDKTAANFTYQNVDGRTDDNDSTDGAAVTNNLISWDGSLFTVPTASTVP
ncbi:MAG: hypothetical protein HY540_08170 [Deltaproteobacteria bacterium]|nr:hypothetical protein [Deltaproteobacteria bacterium]